GCRGQHRWPRKLKRAKWSRPAPETKRSARGRDAPHRAMPERRRKACRRRQARAPAPERTAGRLSWRQSVSVTETINQAIGQFASARPAGCPPRWRNVGDPPEDERREHLRLLLLRGGIGGPLEDVSHCPGRKVRQEDLKELGL